MRTRFRPIMPNLLGIDIITCHVKNFVTEIDSNKCVVIEFGKI
jgi:hypothetical protein